MLPGKGKLLSLLQQKTDNAVMVLELKGVMIITNYFTEPQKNPRKQWMCMKNPRKASPLSYLSKATRNCCLTVAY